MPARDQSYEVFGTGRHTSQPFDQRDSYEYAGYAGGAENARKGLANQADRAATRTGPQIDNTQASGDLASAIGARGNEQYLGNYLSGVMSGAATPAQAQLAQQTFAAQGAQRSAAASGRGFGAMAGAPRNGLLAAQQIGIAGNQQLAIQRAQDMAMARDQYGSVVDAMRGQDLASRGMLQDQAYRQAQLEDEQRARNDQMAQFYLGERYKVGTAQLGANQDFESHNAANIAGENDLNWAQLQRRDAQNDAYRQGTLKMGGETLAAASATSSDSDDDRRVRGA